MLSDIFCDSEFSSPFAYHSPVKRPSPISLPSDHSQLSSTFSFSNNKDNHIISTPSSPSSDLVHTLTETPNHISNQKLLSTTTRVHFKAIPAIKKQRSLPRVAILGQQWARDRVSHSPTTPTSSGFDTPRSLTPTSTASPTPPTTPTFRAPFLSTTPTGRLLDNKPIPLLRVTTPPVSPSSLSAPTTPKQKEKQLASTLTTTKTRPKKNNLSKTVSFSTIKPKNPKERPSAAFALPVQVKRPFKATQQKPIQRTDDLSSARSQIPHSTNRREGLYNSTTKITRHLSATSIHSDYAKENLGRNHLSTPNLIRDKQTKASPAPIKKRGIPHLTDKATRQLEDNMNVVDDDSNEIINDDAPFAAALNSPPPIPLSQATVISQPSPPSSASSAYPSSFLFSPSPHKSPLVSPLIELFRSPIASKATYTTNYPKEVTPDRTTKSPIKSSPYKSPIRQLSADNSEDQELFNTASHQQKEEINDFPVQQTSSLRRSPIHKSPIIEERIPCIEQASAVEQATPLHSSAISAFGNTPSHSSSVHRSGRKRKSPQKQSPYRNQVLSSVDSPFKSNKKSPKRSPLKTLRFADEEDSSQAESVLMLMQEDQNNALQTLQQKHSDELSRMSTRVEALRTAVAAQTAENEWLASETIKTQQSTYDQLELTMKGSQAVTEELRRRGQMLTERIGEIEIASKEEKENLEYYLFHSICLLIKLEFEMKGIDEDIDINELYLKYHNLQPAEWSRKIYDIFEEAASKKNYWEEVEYI
ncbi:uncharacterized protein MONOS_1099 [Monocercomonoides exilis]|uniref:uncharacterized protein n=1 Tax=Monocercomonoides exilis TaxID=2049356 RepID=UPI00355A3515|nr:hypothetical protein MONOS_1099 [Monocercomonoides exilis]|eukprot:MONOS_1099.1-p1 / transcript=MONOS_1099.1 / gene=MONOS_1099 / organism=Monocercomonoides_exilis_PA203 / gene_product=unspecified product / transcript_product=unspecified product / location=Mono_scaffold00018:207810-210218(-) / protein_length=758 / sequence_SO=supercontig / SO=protein_coding / is_pseudo=false